MSNEVGHAKKLRRALETHVGTEMLQKIMSNGREVTYSTSPNDRVKYFKEITDKMDELLDCSTRKEIRYTCKTT